MDAVFEVLTEEGWTNRVLENVESVRVAAAPGTEGLEFTLIGERADRENQLETGILDIAPRHEDRLATPVPRTDAGKSIPVAIRDEDSRSP